MSASDGTTVAQCFTRPTTPTKEVALEARSRKVIRIAMNATASVWDLDEDYEDNVDDPIPASGSIPARNSGIVMRSTKRHNHKSPLERCLEECAQHGENVLIIEDTATTNFFQVEDAGTIDFLEIVVTNRDGAAQSGKRARIQLLSRKGLVPGDNR